MKSMRIPHFSNAAFSLVEVTLAMGIAALGIIAVLGLMPQGLEMSRKTGELSAHRQINEQIVNNLNQKSWTDLITPGPPTLHYYDDQALEVTADAAMRAITAHVEVTHLDGKTALPAGAPTEPYLAKVTVKIATTANPNFSFADTNRKNFVTSTHLIARAK